MDDLELYDLMLKSVINFNDPDADSDELTKIIRTNGIAFHQLDLASGSKHADLGRGDTRRRKVWLNVSNCITQAGAKYRDRNNKYVSGSRTLDSLEPSAQFMEGYVVDEEHSFHKFAFARASSEHVSNSSVPYEVFFMFYCLYAKEKGLFPRVAHYFRLFQSIMVLTDYQPYTLRNGKLETIRLRYDVISVMEVLLTAILLTFDVDPITIGNYKSDDIIRQYADGLLPSPKTVNNSVRSATTWLFKKYGLFSEYVNVNVTNDYCREDIMFRTLHPVAFSRIRSPNFPLRNSKFYIQGRDEAIDIFEKHGMKTLALMSENALIDEANYRNKDEVRLSCLLLSLAQMGGYGRAWKRTSAPESVPDDPNTKTDTFRENLIKLYGEAKRMGLNKVSENPESVARHFFTQMKTTGAGQSKKFELSGKEGKMKITSTKKPLIILTEGKKIMNVQPQVKGEYFESGSRDVPVKASRLIFPVRTGTLLKQSFVSHQMLSVSSRTTDELRSDRPLYSRIAVGDGETTGSRIIDDAWIINLSGLTDGTKLPIGIDLSAFDSHMVWSNFRQAQIDAKKHIATIENMKYFDLEPNELVEQAYGAGYMHQTYWNVGRHVGFAPVDSPSVESMLSKPLRTPPGVRAVAEITDEKVNDDDILGCRVDGSDLVFLESHGSGEITTLLDNSVHNLSLIDDVMKDVKQAMNVEFEVVRDQYVGDDSQQEVWFTRPLSSEEYDVLISVIVSATKRYGHVVNPVKLNSTFLSAEFRATHAKCGIYFGQDRIMIHSRENASNVSDVAGALNSYAALLMEKNARGFKHISSLIQFGLLTAHLTTYRVGRSKIVKTTLVDENEESANRVLIFTHPLIGMLPRVYGGAGVCSFNLGVRSTPSNYTDGMTGPEITILDKLRNIYGKLGLLKNDYEIDSELVKSAFKHADGQLLNDAIGNDRMKPKNIAMVKDLIGFDLTSVARRTFTHWIKSEPGLRVRSARAVGEARKKYISDILDYSEGRKRYRLRNYEPLNEDLMKVTSRLMFEDYSSQWVDPNIDVVFQHLRTVFGVRRQRRLMNRKPLDMRTLFRADPFISNVWRVGELVDLAVLAIRLSLETGLKVEDFFGSVGFNRVDAGRIAQTLSSLQPEELLETDIDGMLSDGFSATLGVLNDERTVSRIGSVNKNVNMYVVTTLQNNLLRWYSALYSGRGYQSNYIFSPIEDIEKRAISEFSTLDYENQEIGIDGKSVSRLQRKIVKLFKADGVTTLSSLRDY